MGQHFLLANLGGNALGIFGRGGVSCNNEEISSHFNVFNVRIRTEPNNVFLLILMKPKGFRIQEAGDLISYK